MVLFQKIPPVPFPWAGGFLFLFLFFGVVSPVRGEEFSPPSAAHLEQESTWKNTQFKLLIDPPKAELLAPVEIYLLGKKLEMETPFAGSIRLGVEKMAPTGGSLQETDVGVDDQEGKGWWRVTHIFREAGDYSIRVTFTDSQGEIFVLQGKVSVAAPIRASKKFFWIGLGGALLLVFFLFPILKAWGRSKRHA